MKKAISHIALWWGFFLDYILCLTEYRWYREYCGGSWYLRQCTVTYDKFWTRECCYGDAPIKDFECYDNCAD